MASFRKHNDKWQAQVRRTGHAPRTKSFTQRADAARWIRQTELDLDRAVLGFDPSLLEETTVAGLLDQCAEEVTAGKSGCEPEALRIAVFRSHHGPHELPDED